MSTINTILKDLKSNTNLILNDEQNNTLYKYASTVLLPYNTLNYKQSKLKDNRYSIKVFTTDKRGTITNISFVIYLLCKKSMPYIQFNKYTNSIIGNNNSIINLYTYTSNKLIQYRKQQGIYKLEDNIRLHEITQYCI